MDRDTMGKLIATKSVLLSTINLLSIEQMRILHDIESRNLADLTRQWSFRGALSVVQADTTVLLHPMQHAHPSPWPWQYGMPDLRKR